MGTFPSLDFHLIVGKFTQDTGDTAAPPSAAAHLVEKVLNYMKLILNWEKIFSITYDAIE
jgi:hypothetical protein